MCCLLFVDSCLSFVRWWRLKFAGCCLFLFVVRLCLLFLVSCLSIVVRWFVRGLLFVVCCSSGVVYCLLCVVVGRLFGLGCALFVVRCLLLVVRCLLSLLLIVVVSCLLTVVGFVRLCLLVVGCLLFVV